MIMNKTSQREKVGGEELIERRCERGGWEKQEQWSCSISEGTMVLQTL